MGNERVPDVPLRSTLQHERVRPMPNSPRGGFVALVKENVRVCTDHYRLVLTLGRFPKSFAGQFIQIECGDAVGRGSEDHGVAVTFEWPPPPHAEGEKVVPRDGDFCAPLAYLRRPFSLASHQTWPDGYTELTVIHRVVGKGTLMLAQLKVGDEVSIMGPMGCGFTVPLDLDLACLVGGGVGIPPMMYLAKELQKKRCKHAVAFVGAQRNDLLPVTFTPPSEHNPVPLESSAEGEPVMNVEEFKEHGIPAVITTDDGSRGMKGLITQALVPFLEERQVQMGALTNAIVYCCGPTGMMKAVAKVAGQFGVQCQVSLEQPMACGMGTCQSCVVRYRPHGTEGEWKYKLTCTDGPVFDARDLVW